MLPDGGLQSYTSWVAVSPFKHRQTWLSAARLDCCLGVRLRCRTRCQPGKATVPPHCCNGQTNQPSPDLRQDSAPGESRAPAASGCSSITRKALENGSSWGRFICKISRKKLNKLLSQQGCCNYRCWLAETPQTLTTSMSFKCQCLWVCSQLVISARALQAQYLRWDFNPPVCHQWGFSHPAKTHRLGLEV